MYFCKICKFRLMQVFIVIVLAISAFGFAPNALAASTQSTFNTTKSSVNPKHPYCDAGWVYNDLTRYTNSITPVTTIADYNGTGSNATVTLSTNVVQTVSLTTTIGTEASAGVIITGVKISLGISVAVSITTGINNAITVTVPPHKTAYGQYGVWTIVTYGHYYYMNSSCIDQVDDGYITAYSPAFIGWNVWTA